MEAILNALGAWTSSAPRIQPPSIPTTTQLDVKPTIDPLPYLPPEIWINIISTILAWDRQMASDQLKTLCLVSRQFGAIGQPFLFESTGISFNLDGSPKATAKTFERAISLTRLFSDRPEIAAQVKDFTIFSTLYHIQVPFAEALEKLFAMMPHLDAVRFDGFILQQPFYNRLFQLPRLRLCHIQNPYSPYQEPAMDLTDLRVTDLRIQELVIKVQGRVPVPTRLLQPFVNLTWAPTLKTLRIDCLSITTELYNLAPTQPTYAFNALTLLDIDVPRPESLQSFFTILTTCTSLEILTLSDQNMVGIPFELQYQGTIPATAAPNLHTFHGPIALGRVIVPDRPVSKLGLVYPTGEPARLSRVALQPFATGTAVVKRLQLIGPVWTDGCLEDVAACFPQLEYLAITKLMGLYLPWLADHGVEELQRFPSLRVIELKSRDGYNRPRSEEIHAARDLLEAVSRVHPCIKTARFHERTQWRLDNDGNWSMSMDSHGL